ncbi:MAG: RNA polymerase factor sigma-54 [Balneolaceae bacterium]
MQKQGQKLSQKQSLQQKLSPQQIQYIKLLQLPAIALEQRIKEEMEMNPVLEEVEPEEITERVEELEDDGEKDNEDGEPDPVDQNEEIDWDSFLHNTEYDGTGSGVGNYSTGDEEWRDLPNPYHKTLLEELENQVSLLDLDDTEVMIADQILGSLDADGYFRREPAAVVDNIAFNSGVLTSEEQVEKVRKKIQKLEPAGIASTDLRDCLLVQLELLDRNDRTRETAIKILKDEWSSFERKHFSKMKSRLDIGDDQLKEIFELIQGLDPKPGAVTNPDEDSRQFIDPDFEVYYVPAKEENGDSDGEFVIQLNQRNIPPLRISPHYKEMWDELKKKKKNRGEENEARSFIKGKVESAQWFIESIRQRQKTLMDTMRTIVFLQEDFFKYGDGLKPMILKDIAERVHLDISTISRVVNGKYVQTSFGVYELKYFFSEGLQTESGEEVSSHEIKNTLHDLIRNENKRSPLSDQALTSLLKEKGYRVARRTVSKYREQLNLPVARLRKQLM